MAIRASLGRLSIYRFSVANGLPRSPDLPAGASIESRQRQFHAKCRAASRLRFEFYPAIVQLHKPKCVCQSDAGAARAAL